MGWMMAWGWLVGVLVIALLVGLIVYAITGRRGLGVSGDAMSVLRERYARGEIDATDYDQRARVLRGEAAASEKPR